MPESASPTASSRLSTASIHCNGLVCPLWCVNWLLRPRLRRRGASLSQPGRPGCPAPSQLGVAALSSSSSEAPTTPSSAAQFSQHCITYSITHVFCLLGSPEDGGGGGLDGGREAGQCCAPPHAPPPAPRPQPAVAPSPWCVACPRPRAAPARARHSPPRNSPCWWRDFTGVCLFNSICYNEGVVLVPSYKVVWHHSNGRENAVVMSALKCDIIDRCERQALFQRCAQRRVIFISQQQAKQVWKS